MASLLLSRKFIPVTRTVANVSKFQCLRSLSTALGEKDHLKEKLREYFPVLRDEIKSFRREHGDKIVDKITINQIFTGQRGITCVFHEGSKVDPVDGIRYRDKTIFELQKLLPKASDGNEPLPEGVFWLLLTGDIPTKEQVDWLSDEWYKRSHLPYYLARIIDSFPQNMHPMAQLSSAVTVLSQTSEFFKVYSSKNFTREDLWESMYEDCMNLIAKLPGIAAKIYVNMFYDGKSPTSLPNKDWTYNYAYMMNLHQNKLFIDFLRLYLFSHADHEGANVSSHTASLVGSGLSDMYLSMAACINGLAGPLHGRANQEVMEWLRDLLIHFKTYEVSNEQLEAYCSNQLKSGGVIPGYGHAALRVTDPRYLIQRDFAMKHMPNVKVVKLLRQLFEIVPALLQTYPKIKNPWPNVDAHSGSILDHFGMSQVDYYTVPFAVSRSLGVCAAMITARALWLPIERPKSVTVKYLKDLVSNMENKSEN